MRISKIASVCKRCGQLVLLDTFETQWVSCGQAFYPLEGLPKQDKITLPLTFSFTDKETKKLCIEHSTMPEAMDIGDYAESDIHLPAPFMSLVVGGMLMDAYCANTGRANRLIFINKELMKPFQDCENPVTLHYRPHGAGTLQPSVAVCDGLILVGILIPAHVPEEIILPMAQQLYNLAEGEMYHHNPPEVDPETGEII